MAASGLGVVRANGCGRGSEVCFGGGIAVFAAAVVVVAVAASVTAGCVGHRQGFVEGVLRHIRLGVVRATDAYYRYTLARNQGIPAAQAVPWLEIAVGVGRGGRRVPGRERHRPQGSDMLQIAQAGCLF